MACIYIQSEEVFEREQLHSICEWYQRCRGFVVGESNSEEQDLTLFRLLTCEIATSSLRNRAQTKEDNFGIGRQELIYKSLWPTSQPRAPENLNLWRHNLAMHLVDSNEGALDESSCLIDRDRLLCRLTGANDDEYGCVPGTAQMGDRFCAFEGAPFPFLVRDIRNGTFKLLGDTFTSKITLKVALGGANDKARPSRFPGKPSSKARSMLWQSDDLEMKRLIQQLGWITLQ